MVFSDLTFIYAFLPLCLLVYWLSRSLKVKNCVLLAASLLFYALGEPVYIALMLVAAGQAFVFAFFVNRYRGTNLARLFLTVSVVLSVGFLFVYKYAPLFIETASRIFSLEITAPQIRLPLGISFYTFQILTYTVDVYRGKVKLQASPIDFFLYVTMFPQLIAGPIVRYNDVVYQLDRRYVDTERFAAGVVRFICGLAKKVLFADYAGGVANKLLGIASAESVRSGSAIRDGLGVAGGVLAAGGGAVEISTLSAWVGLFLLGFQIYFDFSGYSDMAIGLGRMFGFEFLENFRHPYSSKSITEFWRRWHISLGTFFRDYVYIPLGGNRNHQLRNIAIVWVLTGLWHGANWNFVIWGCYFGVLLIAEKYISGIVRFKLPAPLGWAFTYILVTIGWGIFNFTDLRMMWGMLTALFSYKPELDFQLNGLVKENLAFAAICLIAAMPWAKRLYERAVNWGERRFGRLTAILNSSLTVLYSVVLLFVCSAVRVGSSFSPFLYFRF